LLRQASNATFGKNAAGIPHKHKHDNSAVSGHGLCDMSISDAYEEKLLQRDWWESIRFEASLVEAAGQAVIASDLSANFVYWNQAAERLYGWSSEEVVGRSAGDVLVSGDLREVSGKIMAGLSRGDSWSGEFPVGDQSFAPTRRSNCGAWMTITQRRRAHR
jgi:PAS domain-containing protein